MQEKLPNDISRSVWPQVRRLLVLQLKLYIDAFRDICLSGLSLGAFLIDLIQRNNGPDCYFEQIMKLGRRTERAINLFERYEPDAQDEVGVDSILRKMEDRWRR